MSPDQAIMLKSLLKETPDEIIPDLFLGNMSHSRDKNLLQSLGIDTVIQIGREVYSPPHDGAFKYRPFGYDQEADLKPILE